MALSNRDKLMDAARDGKLATVKELVEQDKSLLQSRDREGRTALWYAAVFNHMTSAEYLINGSDVNSIAEDKRTLLMAVVSEGNSEMPRYLLKNGARVNDASSRNRRTALIISARDDLSEESTKRFTECAKTLLEFKADKDAQDQDGMTALMHTKAHSKTFDLLIEAKANTEITDNYKRTCFLHFCGKDEEYLPRLQTLIDRKTNINALDSEGSSALDLILSRFEKKTLKAALTILFSAHDPIFVSQLKANALSKALAKDSHELIELLESFSIHPPVKTCIEKLTTAYKNNKFDQVYSSFKNLKDEKATLQTVDVVDTDGNSLLLLSIKDRHYDIATKLIPLFNVNTVNNKGESALELAMDRNQAKLAEQLIVNGANVNHRNKGKSLLVSFMSHEALAMMLLKAGASVEFKPGDKGNTPLLEAVNEVNENLMNTILQKKPTNINDKNSNDRTALFTAVYEGLCDKRYAGIVKSLLEAGADPYIQCTLMWNKINVYEISGATNVDHFKSILAEYRNVRVSAYANLKRKFEEKEKTETLPMKPSDHTVTLSSHHATSFAVKPIKPEAQDNELIRKLKLG